MKPKLWHIIVIAVGLLVGLGSVVYYITTADADVVTHVIYCVDVETGDLYRIDTEKTPVIVPAKHPTTGRICLVRLTKDEKGGWFVKPRDRVLLQALDPGVTNNVIDPETGDVKVQLKEPIAYSPKR